MQIFWGIVGILCAFLLIKYRRQVVDFSGTWTWAETYLGSGGTYTAVVLFGILTFFLSLSLMTGHLDSFLAGTIGKLFPSGN